MFVSDIYTTAPPKFKTVQRRYNYRLYEN